MAEIIAIPNGGEISVLDTLDLLAERLEPDSDPAHPPTGRTGPTGPTGPTAQNLDAAAEILRFAGPLLDAPARRR